MIFRKGGIFLVDRGEKIVVRKIIIWRDVVKLFDIIEEVLLVDFKRDLVVYLFLYEKFLEVGRFNILIVIRF